MKLIPSRKDYIWGTESWELSCHPEGLSIIADTGFALSDYIRNNDGILGKNCEKFGNFPIIVKLIDARDNLSVQVHPNGKTELWFVLDASPDSEIIYGFNREITPDEFRGHIQNNTLLEIVNRLKVKKGDVYYIPAGTLHSVGKGMLVAEVQQNSDITYRVYDYGRTGKDGEPRELHIGKAVEATRLTPPDKPYDLTSCEFFTARMYKSDGETELTADDTSFHAVLITEGSAKIGGVSLKKGETCFIPAGYGEYRVSGKAEFLLTFI